MASRVLKGIPPRKAPIALAILKAACIKAAAIISLLGAAFIIMILIGAATDIDRAPQMKVKTKETL